MDTPDTRSRPITFRGQWWAYYAVGVLTPLAIGGLVWCVYALAHGGTSPGTLVLTIVLAPSALAVMVLLFPAVLVAGVFDLVREGQLPVEIAFALAGLAVTALAASCLIWAASRVAFGGLSVMDRLRLRRLRHHLAWETRVRRAGHIAAEYEIETPTSVMEEARRDRS